MKIDFTKPEIICWALIPIVILFGLPFENQKLDFQFHDTYILTRKIDLVIIVSVMLFILGFIYWLILKKNSIKKGGLILAHIIFSALGLYVLANFRIFKEVWHFAIPISILLLTSFLIGLFLMLIYLSTGLIKKINN